MVQWGLVYQDYCRYVIHASNLHVVVIARA